VRGVLGFRFAGERIIAPERRGRGGQQIDDQRQRHDTGDTYRQADAVMDGRWQSGHGPEIRKAVCWCSWRRTARCAPRRPLM